jgi:glycosyltransferase involved in cell wall biosynthesis
VSGTGRRLLVVSHPNVVPSNQAVYLELLHRGWDVVGVMPDRWKDNYHPDGYATRALEGLEGRMRFVPVAVAGEPQRHFYLANVPRMLRELRPGIAFIEQEPFAIPALQWGVLLHRLGIPFGLQADENLDRPFPWPAKVIRRWLLPRATWIAARSPTALTVNRAWGAKGTMSVVPHTVPDWTPVERRGDPVFTVGFAGRLVPEKGVADLLEAIRRMQGPVRLLVVGDGPVREQVESARIEGASIELRRRIPNERVRDEGYAEMDVLAVPSRSTRTWAEQFGRVVVEAMLCGRPVVGYESGEIGWVIRTAGGGVVVPEGDVDGLAEALSALRDDPARRAELATRGCAGARRHFSVSAAADALEDLLTGRAGT